MVVIYHLNIIIIIFFLIHHKVTIEKFICTSLTLPVHALYMITYNLYIITDISILHKGYHQGNLLGSKINFLLGAL